MTRLLICKVRVLVNSKLGVTLTDLTAWGDL